MDDLNDRLSLVAGIARRLASTLPPHVEVQELEREGVLGMLEAAERYEAEGAVCTFATFAWLRIRGAMLDYLRRMDLQPRGWSKVRPLRQIELVDVAGDDDVEANVLVLELMELSATLPPAQRYIIGRLYGEGVSQTTVAAETCRSQATVSLSHRKALERLRELANA